LRVIKAIKITTYIQHTVLFNLVSLLVVRRAGRTPRVEVIDLKAEVIVERVGLEVRGAVPIARLAIDGIKLGVTTKKTCIDYTIALQSLQVLDLDPTTAYTKVTLTLTILKFLKAST